METEPTWWQRLIKLDPALVRGFIVTIVALGATVLNTTVTDDAVQTVVNFVIGLFALVAAIFIRPAVTPNAKVVTRDDTPLSATPTLVPGPAATALPDEDDLEG
jgi:hypothetical protein